MYCHGDGDKGLKQNIKCILFGEPKHDFENIGENIDSTSINRERPNLFPLTDQSILRIQTNDRNDSDN
jgi:hypothetical protein